MYRLDSRLIRDFRVNLQRASQNYSEIRHQRIDVRGYKKQIFKNIYETSGSVGFACRQVDVRSANAIV